MTVEEIARACHEVNRGYCRTIGDESQVAWEDAPEWQRKSAMSGVEMHIKGMTSPEESHEAWLAMKVLDGWIWGPEKNPEKKQHPCIMDYHDLPRDQRVKDHLFKSVVQILTREDL